MPTQSSLAVPMCSPLFLLSAHCTVNTVYPWVPGIGSRVVGSEGRRLKPQAHHPSAASDGPA